MVQIEGMAPKNEEKTTITTSTGKALAIVPHADDNQETVTFFQNIGFKDEREL